MHWSDLNFHPPRRTLRQFAGLWIVFLAGLAAWQGLARDRPTVGLVLLTLALTIGPLGLIWPGFIRPIFVGMSVATFPIGWVMSKVLMAAVFYLVFTPVALFFRLIGRDPLERRLDPNRASYWTPKPQPSGPRSYFHQF